MGFAGIVFNNYEETVSELRKLGVEAKCDEGDVP